ncbi:hypothetical protein [Bianquea renquensis]|uniref:Uncharacterized protein n=1 Tax=Bianquea renquensis TaxID=2763661 RepID=A0A926HYH4_9FIRM|nr:hypothetical protein [Bianquea renquensis]MBC8544847.1 hypothetical protein [Bianquea renquensis]
MTYIRQFIELKEQKAGYGFKGQTPHGTCRIEIRDDILKVKILLNGLGVLTSGDTYKAFLVCVSQTTFKEYEIGSLRPNGQGAAQLEYRGPIARNSDPRLAMSAYAAVVIRTAPPAPSKPRDVLVGYRQDLVTWTDKQNVDQTTPPRPAPGSAYQGNMSPEPKAMPETVEAQPPVVPEESEEVEAVQEREEQEPEGGSVSNMGEEADARALIVEESASEEPVAENPKKKLLIIEDVEPDVESVPEQPPLPEPEPGAEPVPMPAPELELEPIPLPVPELEAEPMQEPESEPESNPEPMPNSEPQTQPTLESQPMAMLDPAKTRCALEYMFSEYPSIYPYRESDQNWIRIDPRDMAVLPLDTWSMDNSPFILHGYTRYKHLILGRSQDNSEEDICILGVPYRYAAAQREQGAKWGFTEFKTSSCRPPSEGDYGYWIRRISL